MADTKISDLTAAAAAAGANALAINEAGTSKKLTVDQILAYVIATGPLFPDVRVMTSNYTMPANTSITFVNSLTLSANVSFTMPDTSIIMISQ